MQSRNTRKRRKKKELILKRKEERLARKEQTLNNRAMTRTQEKEIAEMQSLCDWITNCGERILLLERKVKQGERIEQLETILDNRRKKKTPHPTPSSKTTASSAQSKTTSPAQLKSTPAQSKLSNASPARSAPSKMMVYRLKQQIIDISSSARHHQVHNKTVKPAALSKAISNATSNANSNMTSNVRLGVTSNVKTTPANSSLSARHHQQQKKKIKPSQPVHPAQSAPSIALSTSTNASPASSEVPCRKRRAVNRAPAREYFLRKRKRVDYKVYGMRFSDDETDECTESDDDDNDDNDSEYNPYDDL